MCFGQEMRDILPKEKNPNNAWWYFEDLLLAYKYNMKTRFEKDLEAIKPFVNGFTYNVLKDVLDNSLTLK